MHDDQWDMTRGGRRNGADNRADDGSQSSRIFEQFSAELHNDRSTHSSPAVSGAPIMTFMF